MNNTLDTRSNAPSFHLSPSIMDKLTVLTDAAKYDVARSEERRVGKECRL